MVQADTIGTTAAIKIARVSILFGLAGALLFGCAREDRYEVLTFFFTGVPPPEEEAITDKAAEELTPAELARRKADAVRAETQRQYEEARQSAIK